MRAKDGTTLVERAFDELLSAMPGRFIADSAGTISAGVRTPAAPSRPGRHVR